jgi:hypothetical protein
MALSDLTVESVLAALDQFRDLGRDVFLDRYHFGKARSYFVLHNGLLCDSKAIAGAAHGFLDGLSPLGPHDFSGGEHSVAKRLRELGFEVTGPEQSSIAAIRFESGKLYNRRQDIHEVFGGQQQGGICTPQEGYGIRSGKSRNPRTRYGWQGFTIVRINPAKWHVPISRVLWVCRLDTQRCTRPRGCKSKRNRFPSGTCFYGD